MRVLSTPIPQVWKAEGVLGAVRALYRPCGAVSVSPLPSNAGAMLPSQRNIRTKLSQSILVDRIVLSEAFHGTNYVDSVGSKLDPPRPPRVTNVNYSV